MSLGFCSQYPDRSFYLVPIGLNYFKRESFRQARALVDVGEPIPIHPMWIAGYQKGGEAKTTAVKALLATINQSMYAVTTMAPDWTIHHAVNTARHILTGSTVWLSTEQKCILNRNLIHGFLSLQNDPSIQQLMQRLQEYQELLRCTKQRDYSISLHMRCEKGKMDHYFAILSDVFRCLLEGLIALPGLLLLFPVFIVVTVYTRHYQEKARKKSSVKINAVDVLATGKLVSATVCLFVSMVCDPILLGWILTSCGYDVTLLDYLTIATILPWAFYATIFVTDDWLVHLSDLKFLIWRLLNPQLDEFLVRMRNSLREELRQILKEKGPIVFKSEEEYRKQRVLML